MLLGEPADGSERIRTLLSLAVLVVGIATILGIGTVQLAKDGSLWRDEASVAVSLLKLSPLELFGRLDGGQSFPRLYLLAIAGLEELFGYQTIVLRAMPFMFFAAGSVGWMWLLYERFRTEPLVLTTAVLLALIPATWFIQAAMFKPYTFDVFAALVPFLFRDEFYEETLERGERPLRLLWVTLPCALSYPFALVLIARLLGWWISRLAQRRFALNLRAAGIVFGSVLLFSGCLWLTDLRHTSELSGALGRFWQKCVIGSSETPTLGLLDRFAFGWYAGSPNFSARGGLPPAVVHVLRLGFLAGAVRIALSLVGWAGRHARQRSPWASRSLGYAALLCGVLCASLVASYPICPGRLTLFALLPLQVVTLEGLAWGLELARRLPGGRILSTTAGLALVFAIAPTSLRDTRDLIASGAPDDLRRPLEVMQERPDLPMITTSCTAKQIETLPEGIDRPLFFTGPTGNLSAAIATREAWILHSPAAYCAKQIQSLREAATSWNERYRQPFASRLIHVEFRSQRQPR